MPKAECSNCKYWEDRGEVSVCTAMVVQQTNDVRFRLCHVDAFPYVTPGEHSGTGPTYYCEYWEKQEEGPFSLVSGDDEIWLRFQDERVLRNVPLKQGTPEQLRDWLNQLWRQHKCQAVE